jgi:hypothetical protein
MSKDQYWLNAMENLPEEWKSVITAVTCYNMMKTSKFTEQSIQEFENSLSAHLRAAVEFSKIIEIDLGVQLLAEKGKKAKSKH